ncbi:MAG: hypothetical protein R3F20_02370 [Planctomycetota bacterium]
MSEESNPAEALDDAVVVGRSFETRGAQEAVGYLGSQGIPARVSGSPGLATQIWVGEDMTVPLHCVEVSRARADEAIACLEEAEELDIFVVTPEVATALKTAPTPQFGPARIRINRAMRAAGFGWVIFPVAIFAYTNLLAAASIGIEPEDRGRAVTAAFVAFIPAAVTVVLGTIVVSAILAEFT